MQTIGIRGDQKGQSPLSLCIADEQTIVKAQCNGEQSPMTEVHWTVSPWTSGSRTAKASTSTGHRQWCMLMCTELIRGAYRMARGRVVTDLNGSMVSNHTAQARSGYVIHCGSGYEVPILPIGLHCVTRTIFNRGYVLFAVTTRPGGTVSPNLHMLWRDTARAWLDVFRSKHNRRKSGNCTMPTMARRKHSLVTRAPAMHKEKSDRRFAIPTPARCCKPNCLRTPHPPIAKCKRCSEGATMATNAKSCCQPPVSIPTFKQMDPIPHGMLARAVLGSPG